MDDDDDDDDERDDVPANASSFRLSLQPAEQISEEVDLVPFMSVVTWSSRSFAAVSFARGPSPQRLQERERS